MKTLKTLLLLLTISATAAACKTVYVRTQIPLPDPKPVPKVTGEIYCQDYDEMGLCFGYFVSQEALDQIDTQYSVCESRVARLKALIQKNNEAAQK